MLITFTYLFYWLYLHNVFLILFVILYGPWICNKRLNIVDPIRKIIEKLLAVILIVFFHCVSLLATSNFSLYWDFDNAFSIINISNW